MRIKVDYPDRLSLFNYMCAFLDAENVLSEGGRGALCFSLSALFRPTHDFSYAITTLVDELLTSQ